MHICTIRGLPRQCREKLIQLPIIKPIFRFFTIPLIALAVFNSMFAMYHIPAIFDFSKSSQVAHISISIIMFITAFLMWLHIIPTIKKYNTLNELIKMIYLLSD